MNNEIKENPNIVAVLENDKKKSRIKPKFTSYKDTNNNNIGHKFISAKAISNVGLIIILSSIVIGIILAFLFRNTNEAIIITTIMLSIFSGFIGYYFLWLLLK